MLPKWVTATAWQDVRDFFTNWCRFDTHKKVEHCPKSERLSQRTSVRGRPIVKLRVAFIQKWRRKSQPHLFCAFKTVLYNDQHIKAYICHFKRGQNRSQYKKKWGGTFFDIQWEYRYSHFCQREQIIHAFMFFIYGLFHPCVYLRIVVLVAS